MSENKPTFKQRQAFKFSLENGGNITDAMREAGYSEATYNNPSNLEKSDGWQTLIDMYLPDENLVKKMEEGLESTKPIGALVLIKNDKNGKADQVFKDNEGQIEVPDFATRHKYLETALKLKNRLIERKDIQSGDKPIPTPIYGGKSTE